MARERLGTAYVDSGCLMIGDPCYTLPDNGTKRTGAAKDWQLFVHETCREGNNEPFGEGFGLIVDEFGGDGAYPVYVERDESGRVTSVTVEFTRE